MQWLLTHGRPAVVVLPEVPALDQARDVGDVRCEGLDDDGVPLVKEPAARVGGGGGGDVDDSVAVYARHKGRFDLPISCGALNDAEGVDPQVTDAEEAGDGDGLLEGLREGVEGETSSCKVLKELTFEDGKLGFTPAVA